MTKIIPNVYWVGAVDWNLRNFHGYETEEGSSYNAYLIIDEKITLIDTVKDYLFDEMISRIKEIIDPEKIDYVISLHTEMDHSGSVPKIMKFAKNAKLFASPNGVKGLKKHFHSLENIEACTEGSVLKLGKYSLTFYLEQMIHWPDNMAAYLNEEDIIFSSDAFGQHIASGFRWDDEYPYEILFHQLAKYYANIVLPYGARVTDFVNRAIAGKNVKYVCPAHGIMFRGHIKELLASYTKWMTGETINKAIIVYDSMWHSTEAMANALQRGLEDNGVVSELRNLNYNHISNIMTDILEAKIIAIGSPTLNNNMMPTVASFTTYMKGLSPHNRTGFAFGSYGWSGEGVSQVDNMLKSLKEWSVPFQAKKVQYIPTKEDLEEMYNIGVSLANSVVKN